MNPPRLAQSARAAALLAARWLLAAGFGLAALLAVPLAALIGASAQRAMELPSVQSLYDGRDLGSMTALDESGTIIGVRGQRYTPIKAEDASPALIDAVLAIEDRRFYWHMGVDPIGLARALMVNWQSRRYAQGGSTITQQVAKLAFLSRARRLKRKLREVPYALAMEFSYSKDEILSIYLNRAYLGAGSYGFEAAAQTYFGTSVRDLSAAQSAILAGLLRAPSRWSPRTDTDGARSRAEIVLAAMVEAGRLSDTEHRAALAELANWQQPHQADLAPYLVDYAQDEAAQIAESADPQGHWPRDLFVQTTLDFTIQHAAEQAIETIFASRVKEGSQAEAAMVITDPEGAVKAMVGGRDYALSQFNRASTAQRQLGSSFKPIIYAAALEAGAAPNDWVHDAPVVVDGWKPRNYTRRYRGWIPMSQALAISSNAAAVRLFEGAGAERVASLATQFGFERPEPFPSLSLGVLEASPLELAGAYGVFLRSGLSGQSYAVTRISDRKGRVLWVRPSPGREPVIRASTAENLITMMQQVVMSGSGRRAQLGTRPVAGKTGTSQKARDAWFAGFTADYVGVVWMGYDDNRELTGVVGGGLPADIWREAMTPLHAEKPETALPARPIPPPGPKPHYAPTDRRVATGQAQRQQKKKKKKRFSLRDLFKRGSSTGRRDSSFFERQRQERFDR
ncbi:MAG: PBP1A family penicillin-binding protein [Neomegalonema sp.]|nr:PBP1A family penicillin-binding protein [Neomegalonema sp.]